MHYYQFNIKEIPTVYFLVAWDADFVKIGYAKKFSDRLSNIQSGCPYTLSPWIGFKTNQPRAVEKIFHKIFSHCWYRGEWFKFSDDDYDFVISLFHKISGRLYLYEDDAIPYLEGLANA